MKFDFQFPDVIGDLTVFALRDAYEDIHQILIWILCVSYLNSLCTLDISPLSDQQLANNFPSSLY